MILKNDPGIKGSHTSYQLYLKSLHIYWALNLDHNSLVFRLDFIWGWGVELPASATFYTPVWSWDVCALGLWHGSYPGSSLTAL